MKLQLFVLAAIQLLLCAAQQEDATLQKRAREAYLFTNNGAMEHFRFNRRINFVEGERMLEDMSMSLSLSMSMPPMGMKGKGAPPPPKEPKDSGKGKKGGRRIRA
jgi:hypothetical protein